MDELKFTMQLTVTEDEIKRLSKEELADLIELRLNKEIQKQLRKLNNSTIKI